MQIINQKTRVRKDEILNKLEPFWYKGQITASELQSLTNKTLLDELTHPVYGKLFREDK